MSGMNHDMPGNRRHTRARALPRVLLSQLFQFCRNQLYDYGMYIFERTGPRSMLRSLLMGCERQTDKIHIHNTGVTLIHSTHHDAKTPPRIRNTSSAAVLGASASPT